MNKHISLCIALTTAIYAVLLTGCNRAPSSSTAFTENSIHSSHSTTSSSVTEDTTDTTVFTTTTSTTNSTTNTQPTNAATQTTSAKSSATTSTAKPTASTTTASTTTSTTDPNKVTVNGKKYAVGDTIQYTVMVKTAENFGRVKIAVRYVQKGLEIPSGLPIKQQQAVMNNLGIGMLVEPDESASRNGFTVTANKGLGLDSAVTGYAGMVRFYETTNFDSAAQAYRPVDCSDGVELYTVTLKITKPGEYLVDCFEYPSKTRADLTVWGKISA